MEITVSIKDVYGNRLIYPICDKAKMFARIANQKTLTLNTLEHIKGLGFTIIVEQPKI